MMMGAVSGAGGHFARNNLSDMGYAGQLVSSAVISGTVSEIGGGKFANGAITGAFAFMFNDVMHSIKFKSVNWAKVVKELEKLYSEYNEKNNPELYASMGGEIKSEVYDKEPMLAKNACALKLCLALEKAGFYIPNGTSNTLKAANGKSYFVSAKYFFEFLSSNDGVYTREYRNPKHLFNSFKTGIYYQGERLDGKAGAHIDARYNGKGGRMYEQFKTNYGLYW